MTLEDCVKKTHSWDNKDQFYSHYIKSALKWSQNWELWCWETFIALMLTFQWLYLPQLLQRLLAAMWPTVEVLSQFHIILEFLEYDQLLYPQLGPGLQTSSFTYLWDRIKPSTSGIKYRCSTKEEDKAHFTGVEEVPLYLCAQRGFFVVKRENDWEAQIMAHLLLTWIIWSGTGATSWFSN